MATKNLKKVFTLFLFNLYIAASAQEFYISAGGGYALGVDKSRYYSWGFSDVFIGKNMQIPLDLEEISPGNNALRNPLSSYGEGANAQLTLGYLFTKHIGVDLRLSYLFSRKIAPTIVKITNSDVSAESNASAIFINPSLTLSSGGEKLAPYARAGIVLGLPNVKNKTFFTLVGNDALIEDKIFGGLAFGFSTSIGIKYSLTEKMALFAELNYINLTYNPAKRTIETATSNGIDVSNIFYPEGTDFTLKKDYIETVLTPKTEQSTHPLPFSGIGINLGVVFSFK